MPSIRNTRDKFNELIKSLKDVQSGLNAEINAANREAVKYKTELTEGIALALPALTTEFIERLDRASEKSLAGRNFTTLTLGLFQEDAATNDRIAALQEKWISPADKIATRDIRKDELEKIISTHTMTEDYARRLRIARSGIDVHNINHDRQITPETIGEFMPLNRWKYMTDETYRSGYKALRDYVPVNKGFAEDCVKLETATKMKGDLSESKKSLQKTITDLDAGISAMNVLEGDIRHEKGKIKGPDAILDTLRNTVFHLCLENPNFTATLATELGREEGNSIAVPALKIRTLERSVAGLKAHDKGVTQTLRKLEAPMSKLNKGVRHAPSKSIRIDLDGIEKAVKGQNVAARNISGNARTFRTSVDSYTPAYRDDSSFYFLQNYMLMDILMHHHDHGYCHNTIGIPVNCADSFNQVTIPDVNVTPSSSVDFNTAAANFDPITPDISVPNVSMPDVSVPNISVPDIQVSVPDISVPNISVPDISIPNISVPDISISIPDVSFSMPDISVSIDTSSFTSFDSSSFTM